jgi:hypothetical protein
MICVALTGISNQVLKDLFSNHLRTLEIRSPNNFFALINVKPDDLVFLTEASASDIIPGISGYITRVREVQIVTHRLVQSGDFYYEEREVQAGRVQLLLVGLGRVRRIESSAVGSPLMLDVDELHYCDAR